VCRLIARGSRGIQVGIDAPVNALAEQLGGGDGPLAIVWLGSRMTSSWRRSGRAACAS